MKINKKSFCFKLLRNSFIIGFGYFLSNFALFEDFSVDEWKSLMLFIGFYVFAELSHRYHLSTQPTKRTKLIMLFF